MAFPVYIRRIRNLRRIINCILKQLRQDQNQDRLDRPLDIGEDIYKALCGGAQIDFPLELHFGLDHRVEFCFPYELIGGLGGSQFCRDGKNSLVRVLDLPADQELFTLPVNILIVVASPKDLRPINSDLEIRKIRETLGAYCDRKQPNILHHPFATFKLVKGADTLKKIEEAIRQEQYQIVELITHGIDDNDGQGGALFLENDREGSEAVDGSGIYALLSQNDRLPTLVFLNSCLSGGEKPPPPGQFSNVAWQLLVSGISAVIAMQVRVRDDLAAEAGATFYGALLSPGSLDQCIGAMRSCLRDKWYAPILATHQEVNRQVFAEEYRQFLERVGKINREVEQLLGSWNPQRPEGYEMLMHYLKNLEPGYYPLIHKRDAIADIILQHVSDELEILL